jgi:MSHA biogenesis protein MshN
MSVINAMLSKLDERGVAARHGLGLPDAAPAVTPPRRAGTRGRLPAIVLVGGAVIAATALADWPALLRPAQAAVAAALPAATAAAPATDAAIAARAAAAPAAPLDAALPGAAGERGTAPVPATWPARTLALAPAAVPPAAAREPAALAPPPLALPVTLAPPLPLPPQIDKRPMLQTPEQRLATLYRSAVDAAQSGQRRSALEQAHEALALDPRHAPSRLLAAVLEHETGNPARAAQLLREGLALEPPPGPQAPDPQRGAQALLLARVLVAQGDAAGALVALDQHAVGGAEAEGLRGGVLAQQGDFRRALVAYESAARQQPTNAMWWLGLGVALDSEGQRPRARQAYAKARAIGLARDDLASYVEQRLATAD